jgi:hypothetical protein
MRPTMIFVAGMFPVLAYGQSMPTIQEPTFASIMAKKPPESDPINSVQIVPGIAMQSFGADRPGLSDPTDVLWVGTIQIETGFELDGSSSTNGAVETSSRQTVLPQVLFRVGVLPRLELRVSADGYASSSENDGIERTVTKGFSDGAISAKIKVLESDTLSFTILPSLSVPSFDDNFSSGTFDPGVELVFGRGLPLDLDIGVNINGALPTNDTGRFFEASGGVALGRDIVGDLGAYIELFGTYPLDEKALDLVLNGGLTYVFENRYQIDVEYGQSLSNDGDFFFGFGFATRITRWTRY